MSGLYEIFYSNIRMWTRESSTFPENWKGRRIPSRIWKRSKRICVRTLQTCRPRCRSWCRREGTQKVHVPAVFRVVHFSTKAIFRRKTSSPTTNIPPCWRILMLLCRYVQIKAWKFLNSRHCRGNTWWWPIRLWMGDLLISASDHGESNYFNKQQMISMTR